MNTAALLGDGVCFVSKLNCLPMPEPAIGTEIVMPRDARGAV